MKMTVSRKETLLLVLASVVAEKLLCSAFISVSGRWQQQSRLIPSPRNHDSFITSSLPDRRAPLRHRRRSSIQHHQRRISSFRLSSVAPPAEVSSLLSESDSKNSTEEKKTPRAEEALVPEWVVVNGSKQDSDIQRPSNHAAAPTNAAAGPYADVLELNQALNRLAEHVYSSGENDNLHVIARAAACEREWESHAAELGGGDVVSLNTVLKAWGRCAQVLADNHEHRDANPVGDLSRAVAGKGSGDPTATASDAVTAELPPVYTAHDAAQRALDILNRHEEQAETETAANGQQRTEEAAKCSVPTPSIVRPDVTSYNIVMDALAKSRSPYAPKEVQALMDRLMAPQVNTHRRHSEADAVADEEEGERPSSPSTLSVPLHPDVLSWNALIDAYAYSTEEDRLEKIQSSWKLMQRLHQQDPKRNLRPSIRTINSILHAYAHSSSASSMSRYYSETRRKEAQENAEACLRILAKAKETYDETQDPKDRPDASTYTLTIHALSRTGSLSNTEKAQKLFDELKFLHNNTATKRGDIGRFQPTVNTYTAIILSWARTPTPESPHRAETLLNELMKLSESERGRGSNLRPNAKCFTATIQAWARSKYVEKAARALKLLQRMKELAATKNYPNVAPTLIAYQAALDACGRTRGTVEQQMAALKIAFAILKSIERDELEPNHVIYATILKATSSLISPGDERNSIAAAVFNKAVGAGQVDVSVVKALQKACDASIQRKLLAPMADQHGCILYNVIPPSWSKNVRM